MTLVTDVFDHDELPDANVKKMEEDLARKKEEKRQRQRAQIGLNKGEHMQHDDFPTVTLTEDQEAEFAARILVISGSITEQEHRLSMMERMKVWCVKEVDMFLADRPFRTLKDSEGKLYDFDDLSTK